MTHAVAHIHKGETALVDVEDLGRRAKEQLDMADEVQAEYRAIGEEKSAKHQIKAGEYLLRALPYINEPKTAYVERVTRRPYRTCQHHMEAAEKWLAQQKKITDGTAGQKYPNSVRGFSRESDAGKDRRYREWTGPVDDVAARARAEQTKQIESRESEARARQQLAKRLIDIGYKVLAKELHPDVGGSREAMTRLTEVKNRLLKVYGG